MTRATETAVRMIESLPEEAQEKVLEGLRQLVEEARDEWKGQDLFRQKRPGLMAAARQARAEVAAGKAEPMDERKL